MHETTRAASPKPAKVQQKEGFFSLSLTVQAIKSAHDRFVHTFLTGGHAQVDERSVMRKCTWHLVPLFFALATICYLDRANLPCSCCTTSTSPRPPTP